MRLGLMAVLVVSVCALASGASAKSLIYPYGVFDAPAKIETKKLPKDKLNPQAKTLLTCTRYSGFMVKQVDMGEKGAEKLAILPAKAPCTRNSANEIALDVEGYFKGVIGDYIFFDASDGWDGGVPFYVFAPDGKKLFEDSVANGEFMLASREGKTLRMKFDRIYHAPCSMYVHTAECDNKVMEATGLGGEGASPNVMLPDCAISYDAAIKQNDPKYADAIKTSNSVVRYPVELEYDGQRLTITPNGWGPASCTAPS